jgi:hypothetical protein
MTISQLLERCELCGITLSVRDGKLIATAPTGVVTPEAKAAIQAHKPALLAMLADDQANLPSQPAGDGEPLTKLTKTVWPPRPSELACWPIAWRQRWADRAEAHQAAGLGWQEAERLAYQATREEIRQARARGEVIRFAQPSEGMSDADALAAIGRVIWDGTSLAESIEQIRQHNERVRK